MAGVCLLAFIAGLLLEVNGLPAKIPEENKGGVFVSQQEAHTVLTRQRRYNSGHLEEFQKDNLERECREETCTMEEARECFEDDIKTWEFWASYADGDQCKPPPCQNGGLCKDGVNSYTCWCKPDFSGKNCEIEVSKQCSIKNGGCSHFCMMEQDRPVCHCAAGYQLAADRRTCEPTGQFSCGRVTSRSSSSTVTRTVLTPRSSSHASERNSSDAPLDDYYDYNISQLLDYYDLFDVNVSEVLNTSAARSARSAPEQLTVEEIGATEAPKKTDRGQVDLPVNAFFPSVPNIMAVDNEDQRIVGGNEAIPGEIPWQVALMSQSDSLQRAVPFCGGSLLNDQWVITAAHCPVQADIAKRDFFVRVGEHDVEKSEVSERDHVVAERHLHPLYNYSKSPYNHDIALLKLASPVELSHQRRPICLGPKDFTESLLREASTSLVSGWGRIKFLGLEATKLQKLEVPYVERTLCKTSSRSQVTRFMFCAGYKSEQMDSCQGDSGGPHATKFKGTWFLTGIVSWGEECAKDGKYGIYTRVSRYYPWISRTTGIQIN